MKKFPALIHIGFEPDRDGNEDYAVIYSDGVSDMEAGQRVAIYKLVDEGIVRGPKSFVSKKRKRS